MRHPYHKIARRAIQNEYYLKILQYTASRLRYPMKKIIARGSARLCRPPNDCQGSVVGRVVFDHPASAIPPNVKEEKA